MASLGVASLNSKKKNKAMWRYPKVLGLNPPERWGHSACCFDGVLYVFGVQKKSLFKQPQISYIYILDCFSTMEFIIGIARRVVVEDSISVMC